jgi:hypothetical protein
MAHTQNFEVSLTKYVSSSNFITTTIKMTRPQVRLISTLLLGILLAWFVLILERQSLLLNNFKTFLKKFGASFYDLDKECIITSEL